MSIDVLQAELERLFGPAELGELCRRYLALEVDALGQAGGGGLARAVVGHCVRTGAVGALLDVVLATRPGADPRLRHLQLSGYYPDETIEVGQSVGAYTVEARLGEGPLASTVRARDAAGSFRLRLLRPAALADRSAVERYLAAVRLASDVTSTGLPVGVYAGDVGGRPGVVSRFVNGESLVRRLDGPKPLDKAWPLLRAILRPLAALHARGLVHGALHPANVLVTGAEREPVVTLLDAGAHFLRTSTLAGWVASCRVGLGVIAHAAPEQLLGELPTARSDVYSFGMLLSVVLRGGMSLDSSGRDVVRRLFASTAEPLSFSLPRGTVSPELDELVIRMLDEDPSKRPADAEALEAALSGMVGYRAPTTQVAAGGETEAQIGRLLADPANEMCAALLESSVERGADPRRVAEALCAAAEHLAGQDGVRSAWRRLIARAGALYEGAVGEPEAAEKLYRRLLEADPHEEQAWSALERVYRRRGSWEALVELLVERAEQEVAPAERARTFGKIGGILQSKLDDPEQARIAFTQAFVEDPGSDAYSGAVEQLALANPSVWKDVLEACSVAVAADIPRERRNQVLAVMGAWYVAHLGRADRARQCFEAILLAEPAHDRALSALADIHRDAQQWRELESVLVRRADAAVASALAHDLRAEAARVLAQQLNDPGAAVALYEQVLREDPSHPEARSALSAYYKRIGARADRLRVLRLGTESASLPARCRALSELAQAHAEQADELSTAIGFWESALAAEPRNATVLRSLEVAYRAVGQPAALAKNLESQLELGVAPAAAVALLERLARVQQDDLLDREAAARTLQRLVDIEPRHPRALLDLAALQRGLKQWEALALTLERTATQAEGQDGRVAALAELAAICATELGQPERAIAAWEQVVLEQPSNAGALDALATLRMQVGDADSAVDALLALADGDATREGRAGHLVRAGRLLAHRGRVESAIDCYRRALDASPGDSQAARLLTAMLVERGDAAAAVDVLERAEAAVQADVDRADLIAELAWVLAEHLGDRVRARVAAGRALHIDASHVRAHRVLGDLDRAAGRWDAARDHYDAVVRAAGHMAPAGGSRLLQARAQVLAKGGHTREVWAALEDLLARFPADAEALRTASEIAFLQDEPLRALELSTALIDKHGEALSPEGLAAALYRRGELLRRLGRGSDAIALLQRAAEVDARATEPLRSLADVFRSAERWADQDAALRKLLARLSGDAHTDVLVEVGDLAAGGLNDPASAAVAYVGALTERPGDHGILVKLVHLHSKERDWGHLIEDIAMLASVTEDGVQRGKYLTVAARIAATEQSDPARAKELLASALAADPLSETIVSALLELLGKEGDTDGIRTLLERQIAVASEAHDRERALGLVGRLAELHLTELHAEDAIAINEAALDLSGEDPDREGVLADLYATDPVRYLDRAVRLERRILARDPFAPEPYHVLRRMYEAVNRRDATWCCCQSLVCLHRAGEDEERYFARHRRGVPLPNHARVTEEDWERLVLHPHVDRSLMQIFVQISPIIASARGRSLEELGLEPRAAIRPENFPGTLGWALGLASSVFRQELPLTFEDAGATTAIRMGGGERPVLLLSRDALRAVVSPMHAAFVAAAHLTYCRPGFYPRTLLPLLGLKAWVLAAIKVVAPRMPIAAELEGPATEAYEVLRGHPSRGIQDRLAGAVNELLKKGARADVSRWLAGVDLTCDRAGLIVCDDLETALGIVRASRDTATGVPVAERMRALMEYSVSQEYLTLRDHLRVGVDWRHRPEVHGEGPASGTPPATGA